ncbi:hypothetical protein AAGS39_47840 [Flavobacterium sp. CGRL2]
MNLENAKIITDYIDCSLVLFIYVFIDLCFIRAEISKIQKEREVLERYPL